MAERSGESQADTEPAADSGASGPTSTSKKRAVNVGDVLGRYELVEEIGEGGMATVYRARDKELRRDVAVKVLFGHLAKRDDIVRRFHREARAAAVLEHANILRIYDVGGGEGDRDPRRDAASSTAAGGAASIDPPYMVMELIRGPTLLGEIEARGPMLAELAACVGALLADALAAAHDKGVVHRDVKPSNVLIAPGGRVLLADFGVAHLETEDSLVTRTGALLGTPAYMSPEQATGETTTAQSDIYSLGATLYQLVTGTLPYSGPPAKVIAQITHGSAPPAVRRRAEVGPDLSRAIERLMDIEPARRPANATEVAAELRAIASAGGLGDAREELAAYFGSPDDVVKARTPVVVSAVVAAAEKAIVARKLPRAMALADRASAIAPEDTAVKSLVDAVTRGGRASRRRKLLAIGALAIAGASAAVLGVRALVMRGGSEDIEDTGGNVATAVSAKDATLFVAPPPPVIVDAAQATAVVEIDAMPVPRAVDAGIARVVRARDAAEKPDAVEVTAATIPIDALPPPDAPPAMGTITVKNTPWCDIFVDNKLYGRRYLGKPITVTASRHVVRCEQPDKPEFKWTQEVDVVADQDTPIERSFLKTYDVVIGTKGDVQIDNVYYPKGSVAHLGMPQRYSVLEPGVDKQYMTLKHACTLHEQPGPEHDVLVCE